MAPQELILALQKFRDRITAKPEDDRTKRENLIVEMCQALEEQVRRYDVHGPAAATRQTDDSVSSILRVYNEVNREHDLVDADISLAAAIRKGKGNGSR